MEITFRNIFLIMITGAFCTFCTFSDAYGAPSNIPSIPSLYESDKEYFSHIVITNDDHENGSFAQITLNNGVTTSPNYKPRKMIIKFEYGEVILEYERTRNADCTFGCPDRIEIIDMPYGIIANPIILNVPEEDSGTIFLYIFDGS